MENKHQKGNKKNLTGKLEYQERQVKGVYDNIEINVVGNKESFKRGAKVDRSNKCRWENPLKAREDF